MERGETANRTLRTRGAPGATGRRPQPAAKTTEIWKAPPKPILPEPEVWLAKPPPAKAQPPAEAQPDAPPIDLPGADDTDRSRVQFGRDL